MRRTCLSLLSLCAVAACAGPRQGASSFEASYSPSDTPMPTALPSCARPVEVVVSEARKDTSRVGLRFAEDAPTETYPIQMSGQVVSYVQFGLERAFQRAGNPPGGTNPVRLDVAVTQFFVEEKIYRNAEFDGRVGLNAVLTLPGSSQPCWTGQATGFAENYGRAGNPENYQETFNAALDRAAAELFQSAGFADALCGRCSAPQQ